MLRFLQAFFGAAPPGSGLFYGKLAFGLLFVFAILGAMQAAPRRARKPLIALFTFLGGLYYVAEFFWPAHGTPPKNPLTDYTEFVANLSAVISSFGIGIGVISLMQLHGRAVARQRPGWGNSVALIVSFLLMTVFGIAKEYYPTSRLLYFRSDTIHHFLFDGGLVNLGAATFSLIAFFIASASYRAFRVRSLESTLLMVAALIVMLGSVSFGTTLTNWLPTDTDRYPQANFRIENIAQWLLTKVNAPAQRGILFGLTVGGLAVSLRLWLSLERGAYFDKEV